MREEKTPAVYIMASRYRGTLYVGVTSGLWNRVNDHKNERYVGFTAAYDVKLLVWYEHHHTMEDAIRREKDLPPMKGTATPAPISKRTAADNVRPDRFKNTGSIFR